MLMHSCTGVCKCQPSRARGNTGTMCPPPHLQDVIDRVLATPHVESAQRRRWRCMSRKSMKAARAGSCVTAQDGHLQRWNRDLRARRRAAPVSEPWSRCQPHQSSAAASGAPASPPAPASPQASLPSAPSPSPAHVRPPMSAPPAPPPPPRAPRSGRVGRAGAWRGWQWVVVQQAALVAGRARQHVVQAQARPRRSARPGARRRRLPRSRTACRARPNAHACVRRVPRRLLADTAGCG